MKKTFGILSGLSIRMGIVIAVLLVVSYLNLRVDLSAQKAYSLSKVSKDTMRGLEDIMVVKVLASDDLPAELNSLSRYLRDLLSEYQMVSRGKFRYEYVRNLSRDDLFAMAHANNISVMRFQTYEKDQMTSKEVIFGAIFEYQGKVESISLVPRTEARLEYELTQRIQSIAQHTLPKIAVFRDTTYYDFNTNYFERNLRANFAIHDSDLKQEIRDVDALLFTGSARNLTDDQLYHLDQYLMKGGRAVFLQDRIDTDGYSLYSLDTNLIKMLEHYGFVLSKDVLLDMYCDQRQTGLGVMANYPMYPVLRGSNHPITRNIDNISLYLASGVSFSGRKGVSFEPILQSSIYSGWMEYPEFQIEKDLFYDTSVEDFDAGSIVTGALLKGQFDSFFADSLRAQNDPGFVAQSPQMQMVLFGDKELVIDTDREIYNDRNYIILNALDFLSDREDMIRIRSRLLGTSSLSVPRFMQKLGINWGDMAKIESNIKTAAKSVAIALPALILILVGIIRALRRKYRVRFMYE
jgi:gliding-associated putative ABC transporter substrate-binding component GldG